MSKLRPLLNAGAFVTVVASEIRDELNIPDVFPIKREFILSDLDNQGFVVSADPGDVNRVVALAAEERRVFVNAVDELASASAYLGCVATPRSPSLLGAACPPSPVSCAKRSATCGPTISRARRADFSLRTGRASNTSGAMSPCKTVGPVGPVGPIGPGAPSESVRGFPPATVKNELRTDEREKSS